jgi:hypothetical protein
MTGRWKEKKEYKRLASVCASQETDVTFLTRTDRLVLFTRDMNRYLTAVYSENRTKTLRKSAEFSNSRKIYIYIYYGEPIGNFCCVMHWYAGHVSREVLVMNCLFSLESRDHGFESHTRHGCILCVCVYSAFILLCV